MSVIQLRRTKGWRKPEGAVVVARPSRWGNPFKAGSRCIGLWRDGLVDYSYPEHEMDREEAVERFRDWIENSSDWRAVLMRKNVHELRGKTLACWCPQPGPCHAHVLAEMAADA